MDGLQRISAPPSKAALKLLTILLSFGPKTLETCATLSDICREIAPQPGAES